MKIVKIKGMPLAVPEKFRKQEALQGNGVGSKTYSFQTTSTGAAIVLSAISPADALPFGEVQPVINGIHREMDENQGLLAVETGETSAGRAFIYSIVKTVVPEEGVTYTLALQVDYGEQVLNLTGFFGEMPEMVSVREAAIFAVLKKDGALDDNLTGWENDPYDAAYTRGKRMNLAESVIYDERFPEHCLSELRAFVRDVITNN